MHDKTDSRREREYMWISKRKWNALEKRIADIEEKVQSRQESASIEDLTRDVAKRLRNNQERQQNTTWKLSVTPPMLKKS